MHIWNVFGGCINIVQFQISSRNTKKSKKIPEPSRLKFLETFLAHNFALSDEKDNTFEPLNSFLMSYQTT